MLKTSQIAFEKYRDERSGELCAAIDITAQRISVVYYDLGLARRYARTVLMGETFSAENLPAQLARVFALSGKEYGIPATAVKKLGFAAPIALSCFIEEQLTPTELFLRPETEIFVMPYISAAISGRFTASLLSLPQENCLAGDFSDKLLLAAVEKDRITCAAFPSAGAFDGSAIESGMCCERGAIDEIRRESDGTLCYGVVADADGIGVAPSAAFSAARLMLSEGIIDTDGIMTDRDLFFIGEDIYISQSDIRAVQTDRARCEAALSVFEKDRQFDGRYFSGDVFACGGAAEMLSLRALPESCGRAGFAKNSVEQGIIRCLESEEEQRRAAAIAMSAQDITEELLSDYEELCMEKFGF